jgi:hypothetical protein
MPKLRIRVGWIRISASSLRPADPPGAGIAWAVPLISRKRAPRVGRGDVVDHKRGPAVAADVAELLARGHVEAGHVDRAQPWVVAEADRLDPRAAIGLHGGQPTQPLAGQVAGLGIGEGHVPFPS